MEEITVYSLDYYQMSKEIKREIVHLLHVVWPSDDCNDAHNEELTVQSFYIMKDNQVVSYGAVLRMETTIDNEKYQIGGLSCIATLPNYRRQGLSSKIVQTATKWIEDNLDFGIFTCKRELEDFYACNGKWQVANNVVLIANRDNNALSSNKLAVIVLIRLFSKNFKCENLSGFASRSIYLKKGLSNIAQPLFLLLICLIQGIF